MPLTITPSNVVIPNRSAVVIQPYMAGVAINAGQMFYEDANGFAQLADNTAQDTSQALAMATNSAAANQPLEGITKGVITIGTGLLGVGYWIGASGALVAESELIGANWATFVGLINQAGHIDINILIGNTQRV